MDRRSRKYSKRNVEKAGIMTNKKFVKKIYRKAFCRLDSYFPTTYYVYTGENDDDVISWGHSLLDVISWGHSPLQAWYRAKDLVNKKIMAKLES